MKVRCWLLRHKFSPYLDGELSAAEAANIEGHLGACGPCRSLYLSMEAASKTLRGLPRLEPRDLALPKLQAEPGSARETFSLTGSAKAKVLRWVGVTVGVIALVFALTLTRKQPGPPSGFVVQAYALNMELYLDGLSQDRSQLERFAKLYESRSVSLEEAQAHVSFKIAAPGELPGGLRFASVYLLKSGCCNAVQLRYHRPGAEVDLFQGPQGHPVSFGSKPTFVPDGLPQCHSARRRAYQACSWVGVGKNLILVSDLPEREVAVLVSALTQKQIR
jgi:hypothetical protein